MTIPFQNFIPFMGVVQAYPDQVMSGRCKVRCFGIHPPADDMNVPVETLPWAMVCNSSVGGVHSPDPKPGEWVFGFFLDGRDAQFPMIMGSIPGMSMGNLDNPWADSSKQTLFNAVKLASPPAHTGVDNEASPLLTSVAAREPIMSASGEYSVTPPSIQVKNRNATSINSSEYHGAQVIAGDDHCTMSFGGSVVQISTDGTIHIQSSGTMWNVSEKNAVDYSAGNRDVIIGNGNYNITVNGTCNLKVNGDMNHTVTGDYAIGVGGKFSVISGQTASVESEMGLLLSSSHNVAIAAGDDLNLIGGANLNAKSIGTFSISSGDSIEVQASGGNVNMDASGIVNMQNGDASPKEFTAITTGNEPPASYAGKAEVATGSGSTLSTSGGSGLDTQNEGAEGDYIAPII